MVKIVEIDERIPLEKQLDEDVGPIVVMNKFNVDPQEVDEFYAGICQDHRDIQTTTWFHLSPAASRYWWKYYIC
jgi:hypothetical protein